MNAPTMIDLIRAGVDDTMQRQRIARRDGESDDQHTARTDAALQDELFNLLERVEACINRVNANSSVMEISLGSFQDWRHDNCVASRDFWNGKISEARS